MKPEAHEKANHIKKTIEQIQQDAKGFHYHVNIAACASKSHPTYGAHVLAKKMKALVTEWESELLKKAQQAYESL